MRARRGAIVLLLLVVSAVRATLEPDGTLTYTYDEMRGQGRVAAGRGTVHEGDGQRVIVLTKTDGTMTTRVAKSLP